jgi:hypothetical protein
VIAFHAAERWSEDVSENIAREIMRRLGLAGDDLPSSLEGFVDPRPRPPAYVAARLIADI